MTIQNRIFAFLLLFGFTLAVLTGCASKPKYPGYEALSFDAGALEYIGEKRRDVAKDLGFEIPEELTPVNQMDEPVTVAGESYTLSYRFSGNYVGYKMEDDPVGEELVLSDITYQRTLSETDPLERRDAVQDVYQLMQNELGKPEPMAASFENKTIDHALDAGFPTTPVSAKWLISEKPDYPEVNYSGGYEGDQTILIAELRVIALPDSWTLVIIKYPIHGTVKWRDSVHAGIGDKKWAGKLLLSRPFNWSFS